jgi:hypothetical protein
MHQRLRLSFNEIVIQTNVWEGQRCLFTLFNISKITDFAAPTAENTIKLS